MPINYTQVPSPCYVIDEQLFRKNLTLIKSVVQQAKVDIIIAFKGFAMWRAFPILKEYISYGSASSLNEARLAFEELKTKAHTYSPVYSEKDFNEILKYSSHITFNSFSQAEKFYPLIKKSDNRISVGIRVNPEYSEVSTNLYNPCAPGSRLGVTIENMPAKLPDYIEGLHFHNLCESNSHQLKKTLDSFTDKFHNYINSVKWINMGGGHLMTHADYDIKHLIQILTAFKQRYNVQIILEPGAAFVWKTGVLVSTVLDIVENKNIKTAMLNISFTAHMPDCLEMPYKPKIIGATEPIAGKPTYRMGGNSCLAGDFLGEWSFDKELKIGDTIVFDDMIHYTMVKTTTFNGVQHPAIGMWTLNNEFKLFKEFTFDDYKNRLS